jgi:hypothetical protein
MRVLTLWSEGHLSSEQTLCKDQNQEKKPSSRVLPLKSHLRAIPNRQGKETKGFATFSGARWKSHTNTFLRSIELEIGKTEMTEIMDKAKECLRASTSHTNQDGAPVYETIEEVPDCKIIRNGRGRPESSDEEDWVPRQAHKGEYINAYRLK